MSVVNTVRLKYFSELLLTSFVAVLFGLHILGASFLPPVFQVLLTVAVLCLLTAMLLGSLRTVLLAIIIAGIPFQISYHFYRQEDLAKLGAIGGVPLTTSTFCLAILYALWIYKLLTRSVYLPRQFFRRIVPLSSYMLVVIISGIVANNLLLYIFQVALYIPIYLMYIYIVGTVTSEEDVLTVVKILLFAALAESLVMIMLGVTGGSFEIAGLHARIDEDMRVGGTIGSPINAAAFVSMVLTPIFAITTTRIGKLYKGIALITFTLSMISLILTYSRGGWIAFFIAYGLFCLITWHRKRILLAVPLIMAMLTSVFVFIFGARIVSRLSDMDTVAPRFYLSQLALRMVSEHPLLGIGANNFVNEIDRFITPDLIGRFIFVVHNQYLLVLSETGILGLFAFVWFLFSSIRAGWKAWQIQHDSLSPLALAFVLSIIGNMVHMNVDIFHSRGPIELLWLFAALVTSMKYIVCGQRR